MRWIFLSLLLINGLAFLWQWQQRDERSALDRAPPVKVGQQVESDGLPRLVLLSELEEEALQALQMQKQDRLQMAAEEDLVESEQPLCTLVGPFAKLLRGEYLVEHMAALDINAELQEVEIPGDVGYWVYLKPEISKKEALRRLHELQAKGIDSYVIPKGALANGISFGMFSREELAGKRKESMRDQGYEAEIKEIARTYKETWVVFAPQEAEKVSEELWQQTLKADPGTERRQNFCPTVASAENFH